VCLRDPFFSRDDWKRVKHYVRSGFSSASFLEKPVTVRQTESGTIFFEGLIRCGSVWVCPPCSARVTDTRRYELQQLLDYHSSTGGLVLMITRTVPHRLGTPLRDLLSAFSKAESTMRNLSAYLRYLRSAGVLFLGDKSPASVRAREVTYTRNGWHVHTHELLLLERSPRFKEDDVDRWNQYYLGLRYGLLPFWQRAARKNKLLCPNDYGIHVSGADYARDYVAKWGHQPTVPINWSSPVEMTKQHTFQKKSGFTPFDFLRRYFAPDSDREGNAALFREYAEAFQGVRQLRWSNGLRSYCGLGNESEDLDKDLEDSRVVGVFSPSQWQKVCRLDIRGQVLSMATLGWRFVDEFIESL
jgi:hypothetical protein